ncbi:aconitase family protein [Pokkaliibacter sp. MBI-7]|uniref:cis-3-hydroxy-L-proline dehydratase n=1 Tax=Pokkaliibacter sp. MBI-7 TaxID=3040600 RepID=UPI00244C0CAE|nr:aconitase family protein [Pokkaliibacter sp. MBI-7]MDH2432048.1 aconitase family protein [Pokkaliibacter sp. MBI-7]
MSRCILAGHAAGPVLACDEGLSFWGGVDGASGRVIDAHHPLHGQSLAGKVLVLPTSRGSCTGSGVLLELIQNGNAPAALIFREQEGVLTLGALVAHHVFAATLPVVQLDSEAFAWVSAQAQVALSPGEVVSGGRHMALQPVAGGQLQLSDADQAMLDGEQGEAAQLAMRILCSVAAIDGAQQFIDISQVHIDGCIYASPALLRFARHFDQLGARVRVPTTMNAISVDYANWRQQGVDPAFGQPASQLADAYVHMGARASFTCAPYLLESKPAAGDRVAWAESNAVIYANSVLGARTAKHPDFLDLCIAVTGRAPLSGVYLQPQRAARRVITVEAMSDWDDAFWPLLGYLAGELAPDRIPVICGVSQMAPDEDDLKALCGAFGTTSAAPMLHVQGVTPEADLVSSEADQQHVSRADFLRAWQQFNSGDHKVELVAFGSPHFSHNECRALAQRMAGQQCAEGVSGIVTVGRATLAAAEQDGTLAALQQAGLKVHPDICWCSISEPVFPPDARTLMTNSGKYAHYAPGLSGRAVRFGSLSDCCEALVSGLAPQLPPLWLR